MWIKILLCVFIVGFCVLLGYFAAGKYRARKSYFSQLSVFNEKYLNELDYARRPIGTFLSEQNFEGDFAKTVKEYVKSRQANVKYSYLTKDERGACEDYFSMLGKGDAPSQRSYFSSRKAEIEQKRAESEKEAKSRGALYVKLGLLAGLAFVILIV